jgi:hypothetical protein
VQPRAGRCRVAQVTDVLQGDEHGVLDDVLGLGTPAQQADRDRAHPGPMALQQGGEGRRVALPRPDHELDVGGRPVRHHR